MDKVTGILSGRKRIDEELFDELKKRSRRIGVKTSLKLIDYLRQKAQTEKGASPELYHYMEEETDTAGRHHSLHLAKGIWRCCLMVGVNGVKNNIDRKVRL